MIRSGDAAGVRVVHLTGSLSRQAGGPFFSVSGLARHAALPGCTTSVVGMIGDSSGWAEDRTQWDGADIDAIPACGPGIAAVRLAKRLRRQLRNTTSILHAHGLWDPASIACRLLIGRLSSPLVVSPRGMLEPWAIGHHALRKRVALALWQRAVLERVDMFHATSEAEMESIRRMGLNQPVAVVPNGVECPYFPPPKTANRPLKRCVFLSRLHPKKGIPMLLEAWQGVDPPGWELLIAGYGHDTHVREIQEHASRLGSSRVRIVGEKHGADKWQLLQDADLFVLPSYSENFGIAIAEAMAAQTAVITTTATPWQAIRDEAIGWWVPPTADAIRSALAEATALSAAALAERGRRAAAHVRNNYGWPAIGRRMVACYKWLAGRGEMTEDIRLATGRH